MPYGSVMQIFVIVAFDFVVINQVRPIIFIKGTHLEVVDLLLH